MTTALIVHLLYQSKMRNKDLTDCMIRRHNRPHGYHSAASASDIKN